MGGMQNIFGKTATSEDSYCSHVVTGGARLADGRGGRHRKYDNVTVGMINMSLAV
jgi:hypothetical protein